ncbi:dihydrofolate reductase [Russula earlei]|uniref:Dihydrofolate reductase n=1 Tax=Russula earlei TaxID=71964 RepID=A0ACC0TV07_9AGAM|nr:dihydrofolate reductase [Russula earlei]
MVITLIAAASLNNVIGKTGKLPWQLPNDLAFFKNNTWALPVVMGRKSFESLGNKPLNGRMNIIITRKNDFEAKGASVVHSLDEAIALAKQNDYKEVMITGGGEIYEQSIQTAQKILLTRVQAVLEGDAFFPSINPEQWQLSFEEHFEADGRHAYAYSFQTWIRK